MRYWGYVFFKEMEVSDVLPPRIYRPKLMVHAAQIGLSFYNRKRDLGKILSRGGAGLPADGRAVSALREYEERLEEARISGHGSYKIPRHVFVLTALLAEMSYSDSVSNTEDSVTDKRQGECHLRLVD